jgi:hypothetical protein
VKQSTRKVKATGRAGGASLNAGASPSQSKTLGVISSRASTPVIRALSVQQPFAEQIMIGKKRYEYRSIPNKIRERVYVYASKKSGPLKRWEETGFEIGSLPTGVLVGTVEIVDCEGGPGDYAWRLARPIRLRRSVKPKNQPQPIWFRPF